MSASPSPVPSRTPADYRPTDHFINRMKKRKVPGFAIRSAIETGEPAELPGGSVALTADHYTVVVDPRKMTAETTYAGSP